MKLKRISLTTIFLLSSGLIETNAQESINSTGGNATGSGGSASYSVGQIAYTTSTGTNGSVAQGAQQPYEISVVSTEEPMATNSICLVYPNPVNDFLVLQIETPIIENSIYQFCDMTGKIIDSKKLEVTETRITLNGFLSGTYFLKVIQDDREIKTFKIIKY